MTPPLSILYVGAYAARRGHQVDYFDARWDTDFEEKLAKADKTDKNFPGVRRLLILPFELLCVLRWKLRFFWGFGLERRMIQYLLSHAGRKK